MRCNLRHTFASHWVMKSGDLFKLQKILGHADQQMVQRYAHLAPEAFGVRGIFGSEEPCFVGQVHDALGLVVHLTHCAAGGFLFCRHLFGPDELHVGKPEKNHPQDRHGIFGSFQGAVGAEFIRRIPESFFEGSAIELGIFPSMRMNVSKHVPWDSYSYNTMCLSPTYERKGSPVFTPGSL